MTEDGPLCQCGCGQLAPISPKTDRRKGIIKGEPKSYLRGHWRPGLPPAQRRIAGTSVPRARPFPARFWARVAKTENCWEWQGRQHRKGYGHLWLDGRTVYAHRVAYELLVGPIPAGLQLDHLCRNRLCCNPEHLEPVTSRENTLRGNSPTAVAYRSGLCVRGLHPLEGDNVYLQPRGRRGCRACRAETAARARAARKGAAVIAVMLATCVPFPSSSPAAPKGKGEALTARQVAQPSAEITPLLRRSAEAASRSRVSSTPTGSPLSWHALALCESSDNPRAVSPSGTYRGLYQFDLATWRSVGGHGDPARASRAEQTLRAELLYAERGREPWPVCGGLL